MICKDIISQDSMAAFLKWAITDKASTSALASFFGDVKSYGAQERASFLLYNEYLSAQRIGEAESITGYSGILDLPYRHCRETKVRDYIIDLKNSDYGNESLMDVQFDAIDTMLTSDEKAMLDKHGFFVKDSLGRNLYSSFFCRKNGKRSPVETENSAIATGSLVLKYSESSEASMDPIAVASYILNEGADSGLLLSVLKKIGSGTIH